MKNVLSWNQAIDNGFEPSDYSYTKEDIPIGVSEATLDFKAWAKNVAAINCYFTIIETGQKILLSVYRKHSDSTYMLENSDIDFTTCETDKSYNIETKLNNRGNVKFIKADVN